MRCLLPLHLPQEVGFVQQRTFYGSELKPSKCAITQHDALTAGIYAAFQSGLTVAVDSEDG